MAVFGQHFETIYIDLDDEVTTIFARIRATRSKNIALVVPARAQILQSLVSLKILRFKSEHAGKSLTIVTKDSAGRQLAEESGIVVRESLRVKKPTKKIADTFDSSPSQIGRKKFTVIEFADRVKSKLQKISRDEVPFANLNFSRGAKKIWDRISGVVSVEEISNDGESAFVVHPPNRRILFALLASATALLFFIVYMGMFRSMRMLVFMFTGIAVRMYMLVRPVQDRSTNTPDEISKAKSDQQPGGDGAAKRLKRLKFHNLYANQNADQAKNNRTENMAKAA